MDITITTGPPIQTADRRWWAGIVFGYWLAKANEELWLEIPSVSKWDNVIAKYLTITRSTDQLAGRLDKLWQIALQTYIRP